MHNHAGYGPQLCPIQSKVKQNPKMEIRLAAGPKDPSNHKMGHSLKSTPRPPLVSSIVCHLKNGVTSAKNSSIDGERKERKRPKTLRYEISIVRHRSEEILCIEAWSPLVAPHPCHGSHPSLVKMAKRSKNENGYNQELWSSIHRPLARIWPS